MGQLLQTAGLNIPPLSFDDLQIRSGDIGLFRAIKDTTTGIMEDIGLTRKVGPVKTKKMGPIVGMRLATALSGINRCEIMPPDKFEPRTPVDAEIMKETIEGIMTSHTPDERKAWITRALYCGRVLREREENARTDLCTGDISASL